MGKDPEFEVPKQEEIRADVRTLFRGAIRLVLESLLEEEIREMVGVDRWKRMGGRRDYRNGTYMRQLLTSMGLIDLAVPRTRHGGSPVDVLGRYQRRTDDVDAVIAEAYVQGVSTRKMASVTEALAGEVVSRSTVSRITKTLEEQVEGLRKAPIASPIVYLYLDATFLDARWARKVENVAALIAYGVGMDGHRQLLGITLGAVESEASWTELLQQLIGRGLDGVKLVISDDHEGLKAAVRHVLPEVRHQRCVVHLERNVLTHAPRRLWKRLGRAVAAVFDAPSLADARKRLAALKAGFGTQVPEAMDCLESGFAAATQFYAFPKEHWRRIRSTNTLERLNGEIKRRIRAVGAFPDRASALRLIIAVAIRQTEIWAKRQYLDMALLDDGKEKTKEPAQKAA